MATIQVDQQLIRSMIENFSWETDPNWNDKWQQINRKITNYWMIHKKFSGNRKPTGIP